MILVICDIFRVVILILFMCQVLVILKKFTATSTMPEPSSQDNVTNKDVSISEGKEKTTKKSALDGFRASTKGKLLLARINMLDGSLLDVNIEVSCNQTNLSPITIPHF